MEEEKKEEASSGNVRVVCRFRPLNEKELATSDSMCIAISADYKNLTMTSQVESTEPLKFSFDHIFSPFSHQESVYEISARPIVDAVMQGFNGTVFAYGQTSSGKTFTMTGPDLEDPDLMGVIPRMVTTVFNTIQNSDPYIEYAVKVSYCEIYLEKIKDLLDTSKTNLKVHEDKTRGVFIAELSERYVAEEIDVYETMKFGLENRNVGSTNMNAVSSRSHSIFLITVTQTNNRDYIAKTGKLYLVDLAGSEKVGKTGAAGKRLEEAKNINKSLTMLGLVIYSLTDGKSTHIPYRDSKLTRVLQDSLGGNSKTALIITCSPSPYNEAETISTLRFGMRAKAIKNTPKINREYTVAELKLILAKCREEMAKKDRRIKVLEESLKATGIKVPVREETENESEFEKMSPEKTDDYEEIISELEDVRTKLAEEVENSNSFREKFLKIQEDSRDFKARLEAVQRENKELKEKKADFDPSDLEKDNLIERLVVTKESLEAERYSLNQQVLELEKKLSEQIWLKPQSEGKSQKSSLSELHGLLKAERENSQNFQREAEKLRQNLQDLIGKKCPEAKVQEIIRDEISRKEREKWADERKSMIKDLQNRIDRVVELEMSLDDSRDSYRTLESNMSEGERALKRKNDFLERNLEQLTLMYHQLVSQKSQLHVEKQLADKKLVRNTDRIKLLEEENAKVKMLQETAEIKLSQFMEEGMNVRKSARQSIGIANIKRTIQGGCASKQQSFLVKNPFGDE